MAPEKNLLRPDEGRGKASRLAVWIAGAAIVLAGWAAYANSFYAAFLLDDGPAIVENLTIRRLWPVGRVLFAPPANTTASGRPVVNLSLAVNYAMGGLQPWGYHALNMLIHVLAGLALFGWVRRTLLLPRWRERWGEAALGVAFGVGLWWTVHPLQTEAVTYVVQRTEALMGLFYLLTLYSFVRAVASPRPLLWQIVSLLCCVLGMASKEVMVSAPVMVFVFDRTFVAGSFGEAWKRRWGYYLGLALSWVALVLLLKSTGGNRSGTVGFNVGVGWWAYGLTQFEAVVRYLGLAVWPHPLVFEYGTFWVEKAWTVVPYAVPVLGLGLGSVWALWRRPVWGFFGLWFFSILAPTSLVPGTTQMIVEHRMYLALAAIVTGLALGLRRALGRRSGWIVVALAAGLAVLTARRNQDYRSDLALWRDTVAKRPDNALAHNNYGNALDRMGGHVSEAMTQFEEALKIRPHYADALNNHGYTLFEMGRLPEAIEEYRKSLRIQPNYPTAHNNLANTLLKAGRPAEAAAECLEALRFRPGYAEALNNLGNALNRMGDLPDAVGAYQKALRFRANFPEAYNDLGNALAQLGRYTLAVKMYATALRLDPKSAEAHDNFANALVLLGRMPEAFNHYQAALWFKPDYPEAHFDFANALARDGRLDKAVHRYHEAIDLKPDFPEAYNNLGNALTRQGRMPW